MSSTICAGASRAHCIELIWRQQPVAGELREIAAMLEIATDLERIGDYAVDIAKNAIKLSDNPMRPQKVEIDRIAGVAHCDALDAMRAYTERDAALASEVIDRDDEVDKLYKRSIKLLQEEMQARSGDRPSGNALSLRAGFARARRRPRRQHRLAYEGHDRRRVSTPLPRDEFPVTQRYVYFNHAAVGMLPRSSVAAIDELAWRPRDGGRVGNSPYEAADAGLSRDASAASSARAAERSPWSRNTSDGANIVALGIDWQPGDRVLLCDNEFPANAIPWLALRARGVEVSLLPTQRRRLTPDVLRVAS